MISVRKELANVPSLPGLLRTPSTPLKKDHEFLKKGDVYRDVIHMWLSYKRSHDRVDALRLQTSSIRVLPVLRYLSNSHEIPPLRGGNMGTSEG